MPGESASSRGASAIAITSVSLLLALFAGWYAVGLSWSAFFLLDESLAMAIFGVVLFLAPILFTLVALFSWRGKKTVALWLLVPLLVKWVAAGV